jgi:hypothetical protein
MRGQKIVTFPFEFPYSQDGKFLSEFAVTLRAPSLDQFQVHTAMTAFVKASEVGVSVAFSGFKMPDRPASEVVAAAPAPETEEQMVERVISTLSTGLGPDRFPQFMDYVMSKLKRNAKLATIGETNIPLDDATLSAIAEKGGMDAINLLVASFADFFFAGAPSKSASKSGDSLPGSSLSAAAVH